MLSKGSLLLVEDDPELRLSLEYFLNKIGYHVTVAGSATEGLKLWREKRPRAVLLDIQLPDKSGYSLCEKIKQESLGNETVVIFISGRSEQEMMAAGNRVNADYYVRKPVDPIDLGADFYFLFARDFELPRHELMRLRVVKDIPKFHKAPLEHPMEYELELTEEPHEPPSGRTHPHEVSHSAKVEPQKYARRDSAPPPAHGGERAINADTDQLLHLFELLKDIQKNLRQKPFYLLNDDQKFDLLNNTEERVEATLQYLSRFV